MKHCILPLCAALVLMLTACRSHRSAQVQPDGSAGLDISIASPELTAIVEPLMAHRTAARAMRAKMQLSLQGHSLSLGGTLRMQRDSIIQMQLTALGLMEVARVELTPTYFLIVNRVEKQFARARWQDIPQLAQLGVNFAVMQGLFWGELFVPGSDAVPVAQSFVLAGATRGAATLTMRPEAVRGQSMQATFSVNTADNIVQRTVLSAVVEAVTASLECAYPSRSMLAGSPFPDHLSLTVAARGSDRTADIRLSRLQQEEAVAPIESTISLSSYREVDIQRMLSALTGK